jgi:deazaflavin-dependent oxidoreductase (nitroreductase family)
MAQESAMTNTPDGLEEATANQTQSEGTSYNARIIEEFRAHGGRVGGEWAGTELILIHHIGARSGTERVTPVGCFNLGDGRFAIVASNGGSPTHPAWYHNLKANPRTNAEVGAESFTVVAEELDGTARAELWPKLVARYPTVGEHQAKTARQVPVIVLTRKD